MFMILRMMLDVDDSFVGMFFLTEMYLACAYSSLCMHACLVHIMI